jgi:PAS domain S-box-containing protein
LSTTSELQSKEHEAELQALRDWIRDLEAGTTVADAEARFQAFFDQAPIGKSMTAPDGRLLRVNPALCEMLGYPAEELAVRSWAEITHPDDLAASRECVRCLLAGERQIYRLDKRYLARDGRLVWTHVTTRLHRDAQGTPQFFLTHVEDVTALREAEARSRLDRERLEGLLALSQAPLQSTQELLDQALHQALALTRSLLGYIYHYHAESRTFVLNSWSRGVMDACSVVEPQTVYALDRTGLWGEAVRQRRPIVVNDYPAPSPLKKGYPEGHVALRRFLTVPVFDGAEIVAVVGVGNKATDYDPGDVTQLTLMMDAVWRILQRREAEAALAAALATQAARTAEVGALLQAARAVLQQADFARRRAPCSTRPGRPSAPRWGSWRC